MTHRVACVPPPELATLPDTLAIRPMRLDDLDAVMAIEQTAHPTPWTRTGYEHELTQNHLATYQVIVSSAPATGHVLGYAGHWLIAGEAHISIIAVEPAHLGQGVGSILFLSMLFAAIHQGAFLATLEVREHNLAAQTLYQRYGFVPVGQRKQYYKDTREDGIIMTVEPLDDAYYQRLIAQRDLLLQRLAAYFDNGWIAS